MFVLLPRALKKIAHYQEKPMFQDSIYFSFFSMVEKVLDDRDSQHLVDKCSDKTNSSGNETNVKKIQKTQNCEIKNH
jgi:hypothetical protein